MINNINLQQIEAPKTKLASPETPRSAKIIEVIQTVAIRGNGVDEVLREVTQYWSKEGKLLAENDPYKVIFDI